MARMSKLISLLIVWALLSYSGLWGQDRIYLGYTSWFYPSIDYYNIKKNVEINESHQFSGFGVSIPGNISVLGALLYGKSRFYLAESYDLNLRVGLGNTHKIKPGTDVKSLDAMLGLGMNLGVVAAYEFDNLAVGVRWIFGGLDYFTNLDYDINLNNRNVLEVRIKTDALMAQFAYAFSSKGYKNWNAMLCYFFQHDPEDRFSNMYLFLKHEYKRNETETTFSRVLIFSAGVGINIY